MGYDANLPIMFFINYVVIRNHAHTHTHTHTPQSHPLETQCVEKKIKPFCQRKHVSYLCTTMMHMCVELDEKEKNLAWS